MSEVVTDGTEIISKPITFSAEQKTCETCKALNEETVPCTCKNGKGQVAYTHKACDEYKEKRKK